MYPASFLKPSALLSKCERKLFTAFVAQFIGGGGGGGVKSSLQHHKTLSPNVTFTSLSKIEEYIKHCEPRLLNLDNEEFWGKAYFPDVRITDNPGVYEERVEFRHVQVRLISSKELLLGCCPLPNWLCKK